VRQLVSEKNFDSIKMDGMCVGGKVQTYVRHLDTGCLLHCYGVTEEDTDCSQLPITTTEPQSGHSQHFF
jgi:hypothetical protein